MPGIFSHPHEAQAPEMNFAASKLKRAGIGFVSVFFLIISDSVITESLSSEVPVDWIKVSAGREFDLMAPAGTEFHPSEGIDSFVGSFEAPDFKLSFDYGLYSNPLKDMSGDAKYETRIVLINGKAANVVTAYAPRFSIDHPYFIGIHFPEIKTTVVGPTKLTVFSLLETADYYTVVEKIFRTIQFK